ncbi:hypothetical protein FJY93_01750 [Candidatus Kaiserbacteria bacterium]|nr:hypothetical protein [Candidatus Kaiserbacteria bacterium]
MTKMEFSASLALAIEFALKLMSGLLNMRIDYDAEGCPLFEVDRATKWFTTERIADLRCALSGFRFTRLEAADVQTDPDSPWPMSELRHITVLAREGEQSRETIIASFDVHRDYLDGDCAEGWTRWRVKNVFVFLTDEGLELVPEYLNHDDRYPIWGERVS